MQEAAFIESIKRIRSKDDRFDTEAYFFVREALGFTMNMLNKPEQGSARHVSGKELLDGIRQYALQEFGPMSLKVLNTWGIATTADFGSIVFQLVDAGELGKTDEDTIEDFADCFSFRDAFEKPFEPMGEVNTSAKAHNRPTDDQRGPSR